MHRLHPDLLPEGQLHQVWGEKTERHFNVHPYYFHRHIRTVHRDVVDLTKDNINTLVDVTDPDFEPNNVMTVQYTD